MKQIARIAVAFGALCALSSFPIAQGQNDPSPTSGFALTYSKAVKDSSVTDLVTNRIQLVRLTGTDKAEHWALKLPTDVVWVVEARYQDNSLRPFNEVSYFDNERVIPRDSGSHDAYQIIDCRSMFPDPFSTVNGVVEIRAILHETPPKANLRTALPVAKKLSGAIKLGGIYRKNPLNKDEYLLEDQPPAKKTNGK